jgi:hypothetical protein
MPEMPSELVKSVETAQMHSLNDTQENLLNVPQETERQ